APVFQVAFEYQNAFSGGDLPAFEREFGEALSLTLVEEIIQEGEYELVLEVREGADDFALNLKFNPTLFEPSRIAALAGHLANLAERAIAQPDRRAAELEMLSPVERRQLLEDWNDSAADGPARPCFHQLFEQRARQAPEAVAAVCGERRLSYGELEAESSRLAGDLRRLGVEAG